MAEIWSGTLRKMRVADADPVDYFLADGWWEPENRGADHHLNPHLGQPLALRFTGTIQCTACGRKTKKTFGPGYCFPCSQSRAEADICIVRPELCHYFEADNPCRDDAFAQSQCFQPHLLYCSLTSGVKDHGAHHLPTPSGRRSVLNCRRPLSSRHGGAITSPPSRLHMPHSTPCLHSSLRPCLAPRSRN